MFGDIIAVMRAKYRNMLDKLTTKDEMTASRRNISISNYVSGTAGNLAGGNFFTGFLLLMDADDGFMGLITMAGLVGNLLQVFAPLLLERFQKRKNLLIAGRAAIYFFNIVVISIVPLLPYRNKAKLACILAVVLLINLINAIFAPGFAVWHIKSIPEYIRSRYYSFIMITNSVIIYTVILASSRIVDGFKASGREMEGLVLFRGLALLLCIADILVLFKVKEYPNQSSETALNPVSILMNPFREKKYLATVAIACLWSYASSIPGPYFIMYMLKDLKVSYSYLNIINMLSIPAVIFLTPVWRKKVSSASWFKVLYISISLYLVNYIGLSFVTKSTMALFPISAVYAFLVAPGITLVFSNMPYIGIPEKNQTNYIGFYSSMNSLAALLGVYTGKEFISHTENFTIAPFGTVMQNKQYLLLLTAFIMLAATAVIRSLYKSMDRQAGGNDGQTAAKNKLRLRLRRSS